MGRLTRDIVGNLVPKDAQRLVRDRVSRINIGFGKVRSRLGSPAATHVFVPRIRSDYWRGYWDGLHDGYEAGRRWGRHPVVVTGFYYQHYFSNPSWLGFYHPGYHPSIYHYWGWCPGWVHQSRVYYEPIDYIHIPTTPCQCCGGKQGMDRTGAFQAIQRIRHAWLRSDTDLLAEHLTDQADVHVGFDGEYHYSTSTQDYQAMTADMMSTTQTVAMSFDSPTWLSGHEVIYTGNQVYYDPTGDQQTNYVSYRLRHLGTGWHIVGVGSSLQPIQHGYMDFRGQ